MRKRRYNPSRKNGSDVLRYATYHLPTKPAKIHQVRIEEVVKINKEKKDEGFMEKVKEVNKEMGIDKIIEKNE